MNRPPAPPPTIVGRRPVHSGGIGVKRMRVRNRNRKWKIKRKIMTSKNVDVIHRGNLVRKMTVRRRAIFPSFRGRIY